MHPSTLAKRGTVLLFLVIVAVYFFGLGRLPLVGPDEPRYAEVAREMFLGRDLISPTLGGHLWFEKPALVYWMMIASFKLFGVTEWAARIPAAISGLLTIVAVFVIGRRVERSGAEDENQSYAFWSVLAVATMIGIAAFSRAASFDIVLTMTTTWMLAFFVLADHDQSFAGSSETNPKLRNWSLAGFYIFIGLSLLAKGLIGIVIPAGVLGFYYLFQRRLPGRKLLTSLFWGLPLALMVAATWYAPVWRRHGWLFIDQFFIQHHFARYISNKYHHSQPVYYYLLVLPLLALPWTAFFVDGLLQSRSWFARVRERRSSRGEANLRQLLVLALAWLLFPLLFFSFSNSKLPGYILPILPATALIVGERLLRVYKYVKTGKAAEAREWPVGATAILFLLFGGGVLAYSLMTGIVPRRSAAFVAATLLVASVVSLLFRRRSALAALLSFPVSSIALLIVSLYWLAPAFADGDSSKRLLQLADARGYSQTEIFGMQRSDRTPEFYAAGRIAYGADGEPIMYESAKQVIDESARRGEVLLCFVPVGEVNLLTGVDAAQTEIIGDNGRYAVVAVRAR